MDPVYFAAPDELRAWLEANHDRHAELWVGFHKRGTGRPTLTWPQLVDEALCFGWIDGVRRRVDDERYAIRLTPRRPRSTWSAVNVRRVAELRAAGRMRPAGERAFERRSAERTATYSYEQRAARLAPEYEQELRANTAAASFFDARPPWYRRAATHWVMQAKREETRRRRLGQLIAESEAGRLVPPLRRPA